MGGKGGWSGLRGNSPDRVEAILSLPLFLFKRDPVGLYFLRGIGVLVGQSFFLGSREVNHLEEIKVFKAGLARWS